MKMTPTIPAITDHAVVRYLERVKGVDIDATRMEIAEIVRRGVGLGAQSVILDGMRYRLEGNFVVTVMENRIGPARPRMRQEDDL